jgi:hypothetical protein
MRPNTEVVAKCGLLESYVLSRIAPNPYISVGVCFTPYLQCIDGCRLHFMRIKYVFL